MKRFDSTLDWRRLLGMLVAVAALAVCGCASLLGPRSLELSREDIQHKLDQKFPINKQVFGYLDITASRPQLTLLPDSNRLVAQVDLRLNDTLARREHVGMFKASFGLRYMPSDQTIRLNDVRLDELAMPTLPPQLFDALQQMGQMAARNLLQDFVIKRLQPEDMRQAQLLGYSVKGLRVTATGLVIDLVSKADAMAVR